MAQVCFFFLPFLFGRFLKEDKMCSLGSRNMPLFFSVSLSRSFAPDVQLLRQGCGRLGALTFAARWARGLDGGGQVVAQLLRYFSTGEFNIDKKQTKHQTGRAKKKT